MYYWVTQTSYFANFLIFQIDRPNQDTHFLNEKEKDMANPTRLFKAGALGLDQQNTWYPTLKKTVSVLEQLRDYVKVGHRFSLLTQVAILSFPP